jgi:acetoin utilization deacetylase AcuC-like enzyme
LLSAGYDAHELDPLGGQQVSNAGYAELSKRLMSLAAESNSKVVGFLEGGYNTTTLADAVVTTMKVLNKGRQKSSGLVDISKLTQDQDPADVDEQIQTVKKHFSSFWKSVK